MTLALAYAERFPERVTEMILLSITMTRRADVHWLAHDTGRFFPEQWARFRDAVPEADPDDLVAAYDRLLNPPPDPRVRIQASPDWTAWEDAILSLEEGYEVPHPRWADERYDRVRPPRDPLLRACRVLEEDELLRNAHRLAGIPAVLLHGRLDLSGPPDVAWALARAWPARS